jgi:diguanylate cyclase (GGDEF)-like protein
MSRPRNRFSLLSHAPDRGAFVAYFLGAVVPLIGLGLAMEHYGLASLSPLVDSYAKLRAPWVAALFGFISLLSLSCFFMLRYLVGRALEENRNLAYYDSLTGLPNRRMYKDRLEQALLHASRHGGSVAVCFLDLDGFKRVNDTLGHSGGDRLLREVAERLLASVRQTDSVTRVGAAQPDASISRLGGDEFTFLLSRIADPKDASVVARRVLSALSLPFHLDGHEIFATASIGIAVSPMDGDDVDTLLANADTAMYCAKDRGRNNHQFYSTAMNEANERKIEVERCLRRALEQDQLSLHYQPLRAATTATTTAAEALLRWNDPELGSVAPTEFIPIAEAAGLISNIGSWVLRTACRQARAWQREGYRPIRISVNVSGHQLKQPDFVDDLRRVLEESELDAACLELELTESAIMRDDDATNDVVRRIGDLGIGLALDDFGTGYSSLSHLRRFAIDRVKIDRSFVSGIPGDADDMAVTMAIVAMAHHLLLEVVAEGVETEAQAQSLRELECEELQGYLFSPAVPAAEFVRFLEREKDD